LAWDKLCEVQRINALLELLEVSDMAWAIALAYEDYFDECANEPIAHDVERLNQRRASQGRSLLSVKWHEVDAYIARQSPNA
jgi:hypothetical protein